MSAPDHAKPLGKDGWDCPIHKLPRFKCQVCGYIGKITKLLGVDPDENSTLWCPHCKTSAWEYI
jgi:hypothetical protein